LWRIAVFPYKDRVPPIYVHPDAFLKKFASTDKDEPSREVGIPFDVSDKDWMENRVFHPNEQMLIIEDNNELAIFLGCSHAGVINSIKYAIIIGDNAGETVFDRV